ncbi:MAG TPA: MlaD family protein [Bacteroidia bacterium]|nr:MlaD family protein [Bacteroidia bacterium]
MKEQAINKLRLGAFVLSATILFILGLYYIGSKKNVFKSSITVSSVFNNVGGLTKGNNVRFNGINVGTVSKVYATSDTSIRVDFSVDEALTAYIGKTAVVSIGTDGLLGNKLLNISPGEKSDQKLEDGDLLQSVNPLQLDLAFRKLASSNDNLNELTGNVIDLYKDIQRKNALWKLLNDSTVAFQLKYTVKNMARVSEQALAISQNLHELTEDIRNGKGSLGALISDTSLLSQLKHSSAQFQSMSDTLNTVSVNLSRLMRKLDGKQGSAGKLLNDSMSVYNFNKTVLRIDTAARNFDEDVKALRQAPFLKDYFNKPKKRIKD